MNRSSSPIFLSFEAVSESASAPNASKLRSRPAPKFAILFVAILIVYMIVDDCKAFPRVIFPSELHDFIDVISRNIVGDGLLGIGEFTNQTTKLLMAAATQPEKKGGGGDTVPSGTIAPQDAVKKAGQYLSQGDASKASEIISEVIRDCEKGTNVHGDCLEWLSSLKGLKAVLDAYPERKIYTNSIGMTFVRIPAGEFMMGSLKQEMDWLRLTFKKTWRAGHKQWFEDELPLHPVRITRSFYMGVTEVTVGQFRQFVRETQYKTDAEKGEGGMIWSNKEERWLAQKGMKWDSVPWQIAEDQPVVFVSWNDAKAFCRWLSRKEKRVYRLPTEAEWEMACRGGAAWVRYPWGNRLPGDHDCNFGDGNPKLPESLTTVDDGYQYVSPVGTYQPNAFGLHDMAGNVMEWVEDYYDRNYFESSPLEDPKGPPKGVSRVNKGGNWFASPADGRCAFRGFSGPEMSFWNLGFRVVLEDIEEVRVKTARKKEAGDNSANLQQEALFPPSDGDAILLFRQAMYAAQQQQWDSAVEDLEGALKIYEQRDDPMWIARVKATLAGIYAERNRIYKSKELYTEALAMFRKIGDTQSAKLILARLGDLETSPGVRVVDVEKGSIADKAGVVAGDIIMEYGGETGFRVSGFKKLVEDFSHASQVTLSILNNGEITTTVVPGGYLGVAIEDIRRPPRPRTPPQGAEPQRDRRPQRQGRDRRQ